MPCGVAPSAPGSGTKIQESASLAWRASYAQCAAVATTLRFAAATEAAEHQYSLPPSRKKTLPTVLAWPFFGVTARTGPAFLRRAVIRWAETFTEPLPPDFGAPVEVGAAGV